MQTKQQQTERQADALHRAETGTSLANYPAIYDGFLEKGIPMDDIIPRVNVLTFHAWKAKGRIVRRGEHGVKVITWITPKDKDNDRGEGEETAGKSAGRRFCKRTTVFHISQTDPARR